MPVYNRVAESVHLSDWLKEELPGATQLSRKAGTLVAGQNLPSGAVLGRYLSGASISKLALLDPSATTGLQIPDSILITATDASAGDKPVVVLAQNASVVDKLTWPAGTDANVKAQAASQFAAVGITFLRMC
jgi:hypothetical protein